MKNKDEIIYRSKNKSGVNAAQVLIEALPYIQRLSNKIISKYIIIKFQEWDQILE